MSHHALTIHMCVLFTVPYSIFVLILHAQTTNWNICNLQPKFSARTKSHYLAMLQPDHLKVLETRTTIVQEGHFLKRTDITPMSQKTDQ